MSTEQLAALLARTSHVLLDFDGPVCSVFSGLSNVAVVDELRARLESVVDGAPDTTDPFDILEYAARNGSDAAAVAHDELTRLELAAVATAAPTPAAAEFLQHFGTSGRRVVMVSNNSAAAVRAYLEQHDLASYVAGVAARTEADPTLLKPNPYLIRAAVDFLASEPQTCLMVGDSISDINAARATGTPVVAYANKPDKQDHFQSHAPDAIITNLADFFPASAPA